GFRRDRTGDSVTPILTDPPWIVNAPDRGSAWKIGRSRVERRLRCVLRIMRHFIILSFVLLAGCHVDLDTESPGNLGKATFSYQSSQCGILDCGTDKSVLAGSKITVRATSDRKLAIARAEFRDTSIGRISDQHPSCEATDSS